MRGATGGRSLNGRGEAIGADREDRGRDLMDRTGENLIGVMGWWILSNLGGMLKEWEAHSFLPKKYNSLKRLKLCRRNLCQEYTEKNTLRWRIKWIANWTNIAGTVRWRKVTTTSKWGRLRKILEKIETIIDRIKIITEEEKNMLLEKTRKGVETEGGMLRGKEGKKRKIKTAMILTGHLKINRR